MMPDKKQKIHVTHICLVLNYIMVVLNIFGGEIFDLLSNYSYFSNECGVILKTTDLFFNFRDNIDSLGEFITITLFFKKLD